MKAKNGVDHNTTIEPILLELVLFLALLHCGGQSLGNVSGEHVVWVFNKIEGRKGHTWGQGTWNPVGVMEHVGHARRLGDRKQHLGIRWQGRSSV